MEVKNWLRNLAESRYENGNWLLNDPKQSRKNAEVELSQFISTLMMEATDSALIFNSYRDENKKLSILPIVSELAAYPIGIILLLGTAQVRLLMVDNQLCEYVTMVKDFNKSENLVETFVPFFDHFGGLSWKSSRDSVMTKELLMKHLLHNVCKAASLVT